MGLTRASIKQRARTFLLGLATLLSGLVGSYLVLRYGLAFSSGTSAVPPGLRLILPGCVLLIICAVVVIGRSLTPLRWESRLCYLCAKPTRHFRSDPRFREGRKIGDTYVCDDCGQKYLVTKPSLNSPRDSKDLFRRERHKHDELTE